MPAHLLHRGRPGEAGSRVFPLIQNQGCVPGYFSGLSEQPQQGEMGTISTVPSVLLFHYFIIYFYLTPWFADLQFGLGDSVLLPCKLMKFCALAAFLFGPLRSVTHKQGFTQGEEAARGQGPPHSPFLQHHLLKSHHKEGAVQINSGFCH